MKFGRGKVSQKLMQGHVSQREYRELCHALCVIPIVFICNIRYTLLPDNVAFVGRLIFSSRDTGPLSGAVLVGGRVPSVPPKKSSYQVVRRTIRVLTFLNQSLKLNQLALALVRATLWSRETIRWFCLLRLQSGRDILPQSRRFAFPQGWVC